MYKRSVQVTALARRERKVKEGKGKGNSKKEIVHPFNKRDDKVKNSGVKHISFLRGLAINQ